MYKNDISFYINIIKPIFCGCVVVYLIWYMKKHYIRTKLNKRSLIYASLISSIHIIVYFYLGFAFGFSKSPYNHSVSSTIKNCILEILPIISIEIARFVLIQRNKNNKTIIVITTVILILIEINYNALIKSLESKKMICEYVFGILIPLIASSCLYMYVTLKENYLTVLIIRVPLKISELLLPILTNVNWFMTGTIELIYSMIIYLVIKYKYVKKEKRKKYKNRNIYSKISYSLIIIICLLLVCFMLGLFKYEPITILSNSMNPFFCKADLVIYEKLNDGELEKLSINTIIIYSLDNQYIAHRIVAKVKEGEKIKYQTQGDSNNIADTKLVGTEQIKGVYSFHIKYVGILSVFIYNFLNNNITKVERR